MAIDPNPVRSSTTPGPGPVIENEIPAYRAISGAAVSSFLLGLVSLLCFADYRFLFVAGAAILLGVLARRKIRRLPDILTGTRMAEVGIALGLVFAVSSVTVGLVNDAVLNYQAGAFAKKYVTILKDDPVALALWYQQSTDYRKVKTPDELVDELQKSKNPGGGDVFAVKSAAIRQIKQRLKGKDEQIHFSKIESKYADGLTAYINALVDLDGPGSPEFPEKGQFALLEMVKPSGNNQEDWFVKDVRFPYTPASLVAAPAPSKDDGHGH